MRVHLHGAAKLSARASRGPDGDLVVRGILSDDAGAPLGHVALEATLSGAHVFRTCRTAVAAGGDPRAQALRTDDGGEFCLQATPPASAYTVHLAFAGTSLLDAASLDLPVDLTRMPLALRFESPPRVVHVDGPLTLRATAFVGSEGTVPATGLVLHVTDERGATLASGASDATGHAHFTVAPAALGAPGPGKLRLECSGEECAPGSAVEVEVERRARVHLTPPAESAEPVAAPEEGVALEVQVTAAARAVEEGTVEARLRGLLVGLPPYKRGSHTW